MYPKYRRLPPEKGGNFQNLTRRDGEVITVDNSWVVPYNPALLLKFKSHLNCEVVHSVLTVKYIFKYITKGPDRLNIMLRLEEDNQPGGAADRIEAVHRDLRQEQQQGGALPPVPVQADLDEIQEYLDGRYLSSGEAAWKILSFPIHWNFPSVEMLPIHLPGQQTVFFSDSDRLDPRRVLERVQNTKLTDFFCLCSEDENVRRFTFPEIVTWYWWKQRAGNVPAHWELRKRSGRARRGGDGPAEEVVHANVARIPMVPMGRPELHHMRLLLFNVAGPTSFQSLRTGPDGQIHPTFFEACVARGLVPNENLFMDILAEAIQTRFGCQLRHLFAYCWCFTLPQTPGWCGRMNTSEEL